LGQLQKNSWEFCVLHILGVGLSADVASATAGRHVMAALAFDRGSQQSGFAEINVTPLVDVMLVLLIIFMLAMPMVTQRLSLNFAHCDGGGCSKFVATDPVDLSIKRTGELYWNGIAINRAELRQNLAVLAQQSDPPAFTLRPEATAKYDQVADVLTAAKNANLQHISIEPAQR
jgi:biopolymer transport protein ExbD